MVSLMKPSRMVATRLGLFWGTVAGLLMVGAWWTPGTPLCAALGFLSMLSAIHCVRQKDAYFALYLSGVLQHLLGFYWLLGTIIDFGGFPFIGGAAIFALFFLLSPHQQLIFVWLYRRLPPSLGLAAPLAWVASEIIALKIFPWFAGHTQLAFQPLAQTASIGGALLVSFVLVWMANTIYEFALGRIKPALIALPIVAALILLARHPQTSKLPYPQSVRLVQGNVSLEEKHNQLFFSTNVARYEQLSSQNLAPNTIIIWPESVITEFIFSGLGSAAKDRRLPILNGNAFLLGSLTFDTPEIFYNSALAILPNGSMPTPYHKQVLMPFGEYIPFGTIFPFLRTLMPINDFTAGTAVKVFDYQFPDQPQAIKLSPLICYEDIIPRLSVDAVRMGANILVNMTNDAWFGNTAAPRQHHLIASFRAIETGRYLLRVTNTGLTAIVSPQGETITEVPTGQEATIDASVPAYQGLTLAARGGEFGFNALVLLAALLGTLPSWRIKEH